MSALARDLDHVTTARPGPGPEDPLSMFVLIVVQKSERPIAELPVDLKFSQQRGTGPTGAVNQNSFGTRRVAAATDVSRYSRATRRRPEIMRKQRSRSMTYTLRGNAAPNRYSIAITKRPDATLLATSVWSSSFGADVGPPATMEPGEVENG